MRSKAFLKVIEIQKFESHDDYAEKYLFRREDKFMFRDSVEVLQCENVCLLLKRCLAA